MTYSTRPQALFVDTRSKNARAILSELGVSFTVNLASADLIWMRSNYPQIYDQLQEYQLLNHIPNEDALVDKGNLTDHLTARSRTRTETDLPSNTFYPCTYRLYDEREHQTFFAQSPECDRADEPWILKPTDESRGIGIRIEWQVERVRRVYQCLQRENPESDYIVQRYIRNPLLLSGRKSEIRLYWLIANLDPLIVLLYREGTVRLNTLPFRLGDYDNPLVHLTNIYQQKKIPTTFPNYGSSGLSPNCRPISPTSSVPANPTSSQRDSSLCASDIWPARSKRLSKSWPRSRPRDTSSASTAPISSSMTRSTLG